jgi:hypothetical protein
MNNISKRVANLQGIGGKTVIFFDFRAYLGVFCE